MVFDLNYWPQGNALTEFNARFGSETPCFCASTDP